MSFTITFGWWLAPATITIGLLFLAVIVAERLAGREGAGAFFLTFPAMLGALLISGVIWVVYFAVGAP